MGQRGVFSNEAKRQIAQALTWLQAFQGKDYRQDFQGMDLKQDVHSSQLQASVCKAWQDHCIQISP